MCNFNSVKFQCLTAEGIGGKEIHYHFLLFMANLVSNVHIFWNCSFHIPYWMCVTVRWCSPRTGLSGQHYRCYCWGWWYCTGKSTDHYGKLQTLMAGINHSSKQSFKKAHALLKILKAMGSISVDEVTKIKQNGCITGSLQWYVEDEYEFLFHIVRGWIMMS